jgi:hypothetical protein
MTQQIIEFELAEDTKDLLNNNDDVFCEEKLKKQIYGIDDNALLKVVKTIESPLKILSADVITQENFKDL